MDPLKLSTEASQTCSIKSSWPVSYTHLEEAYQVNYDADMYLIDSQSIKELMENKEKIMQMNDWLFELYKDAVTETFLNQLIDGSFDKDMIIGVEANGEDTV